MDESACVIGLCVSKRGRPFEAETAEGNARLPTRFAADSKVNTEVKTVIEDRDVILRDDGTGGDENGGDGTYSAIIFLDFNQLADNQDRVSALNAEPQPAPRPSSPRRSKARS